MKRLFISLTAAIALSGCASQMPSHIALNPQVPNIESQLQLPEPLAIETIDTRSANFIVRFNNDDQAAKLISPSEAPRKQLDDVFREGFTKAGYQIDPSSTKQIQLQIEQLLTDVDTGTFNYEANSNIIINIIAKNDNHTLTKRYTAKNTVTGPFSADFATLELAINKLLDELSKKIITDPELNEFLQQ